MTLLIVFIATVNIAFGYGLAVYLGHGQLPWAVGTLALPRLGSKSSADTDQNSAEDAVESVEVAIEEELAPPVMAEKPIEAAPPVAPKVEQVVVEKKKPEPAFEPVSQVAEVAETSVELPETKAKATEAPEVVVPEEAKDEPQAVEPEPVVAVEEPQEVAEAESETPAAEVADLSAPEGEDEVIAEEVAVEKVPDKEAKEQPVPEAAADSSDQPAAAGEVDEKFLEGIAAFQSQLEKQVDEPAADPEPETAQGVAALTDAQESSEEQASSKGEDVLAGIESFRAQLATMQQDPEAVEEEPAAQPAS